MRRQDQHVKCGEHCNEISRFYQNGAKCRNDKCVGQALCAVGKIFKDGKCVEKVFTVKCGEYCKETRESASMVLSAKMMSASGRFAAQ